MMSNSTLPLGFLHSLRPTVSLCVAVGFYFDIAHYRCGFSFIVSKWKSILIKSFDGVALKLYIIYNNILLYIIYIIHRMKLCQSEKDFETLKLEPDAHFA
jgi:hypothetical protein